MLIPIGHEDSEVRRIPWVSIAIIALCIIIHVYVTKKLEKIEMRLTTGFMQYVQYFQQHPYLRIDDEMKKYFFPGMDERTVNTKLSELQDQYKQGQGMPGEEEVEEQQQTLDSYGKEIIAMIKEVPHMKWGCIPAHKTFRTMISSMFLHGGWMHLIFNLLFLFLTAPFIEDVWGKTIFIFFYLIGGIFATQMYALQYPHSTVPLVGASGAIAAVMGAFLIRYWSTKIRFFYWIFLLFRGTFSAPAWLMLILWAGNEFMNAKAMDTYNPTGSGGGVAHWAHVWGFVFGVVIGLVIKLLQVEEKLINPKVIAQTTYTDKRYQVLEDVKTMLDSGKREPAFAMLLGSARANPTHADTVETLWSLSVEMGRETEAAPFLIKTIEKMVRENEPDMVMAYYVQLRSQLPDASLSIQARIYIAGILLDRDELREAELMATELTREISPVSPPGILLDVCALTQRVDARCAASLSGSIIPLCLQHPEIPQARKDELQTGYKPESNPAPDVIPVQHVALDFQNINLDFQTIDLDSQNQTVAEPEPDMVPVQEEAFELPLLPLKNLNITNVIPVEMKEGKLTVNAEGVGQRVLSLERIKVISVVKITPTGGRAYLIIDLFLSDPFDASPDLRIIRLHSSVFNPRHFYPAAADALGAFRGFITELLNAAGAKPHPDLETVQLRKSMVFPSVEHYEETLMRIHLPSE
ncbi:MAG: rhomboid family intramembrane serine protease [Candidatus Omnitrophota bacterium]